MLLQNKKLRISIRNCCAISLKYCISGAFSITIWEQITVSKVTAYCISYEWDVFALLVGILKLSQLAHVLITLKKYKFYCTTYLVEILVYVNIEFDFS
jgi:hypothetical protein